MNDYLEYIERMQRIYSMAIKDAMLSNFTILCKLVGEGKITKDDLIKLDRKNMTMHHELLKLVGGSKEGMTDADC